MDDFILFGDEKAQLHLLHSSIRNFLNDELELGLKEKATVIAPVMEGVPFLTSECIGIERVIIEPGFIIITCLPVCLAIDHPALLKALIAAFPETTGNFVKLYSYFENSSFTGFRSIV